jgi:hypothetical protein
MRSELGKPLGVGNIGFAAGEVLRVPGVDQHHLEWTFLQSIQERLLVVTGGLHNHQGDPLGDEVFTQLLHVVAERPPTVTFLSKVRCRLPGVRTQSFASFLLMSKPAHR